jgi:hypothetical protein
MLKDISNSTNAVTQRVGTYDLNASTVVAEAECPQNRPDVIRVNSAHRNQRFLRKVFSLFGLGVSDTRTHVAEKDESLY